MFHLQNCLWCKFEWWELASGSLWYCQWQHFQVMGKAWCVSANCFIQFLLLCMVSTFHFCLSFTNCGYWFAETALYPTLLNWRPRRRECSMVHQLLLHFAFPQRLLYRFEWNVHSPCISDSLLVVQILTAWAFLVSLGGIFNPHTAFGCSCWQASWEETWVGK